MEPRSPYAGSASESRHNQQPTEQHCIETGGELFPDGRSLSLLRNPDTGELEFLLSDTKNFDVVRRFEIDGRTYVPPKLGASALEAVGFPTNWANYESTEELFSGIEDVFVDHGFPHDAAFRAATFVFTTLVPECFPPVYLLISGPRPESRVFLRLLACAARHGLSLVEINASTFCNLPMVLKPTLLIDHENPSRAVSRVISSSSIPGAFLARKRELTRISCAKAIYTGLTPSAFSLGDTVIHVNLVPSHATRLILDPRALGEIARDLQAKLLTYRARNIAKVRDSDFDAPGLESAQRILAAVLGRPILDAPAIQARIISLCQSQQQQSRSDRWVDPRCVAIESLIFHCHTRTDVTHGRLYVGSIAATTETILKGRGEETEITPKAMGSILRAYGFVDGRDAKGYRIEMTSEVHRKAHVLARDLGVPASDQRARDCSDCAEVFGNSAAHVSEIK
jgi:hypothetical protein